MEALLIAGGLALAVPGLIGIMVWVDPRGANWLAARLRGRAVEIKLMREAKERARHKSGEVYRACWEGWEEEDRPDGAVESEGMGIRKEAV